MADDPTRTVTVRGASDDLIEVDGVISAEFEYQGGRRGGDLLAFSDGTVLRVEFSETGMWRITPVSHGSGALVVDQAPEGGEERYTDQATLTMAGRAWVVHGIAYAKEGTRG